MPSRAFPTDRRISLNLAGVKMPCAPSVWLVAAVCAMQAATTPTGISGLIRGSAPCPRVASRRGDTVSPSGSARWELDSASFADNCAMPQLNAWWGHHRLRARRPFQGNWQSDFGMVPNEPIQPRVGGVSVAPREAVPPVIFLSAETTRWPPRAGDQYPRLFDGARDRPAPPPCASLTPAKFYLHGSVPIFTALLEIIDERPIPSAQKSQKRLNAQHRDQYPGLEKQGC